MSRHPDCDGNTKKRLCSYDCNWCNENSFNSSENVGLWHVNSNDVTPREVFRNTIKKYNFYCGVCKHLFNAVVKNVAKSGCPFCSVPSKKLCETEDCIWCVEKSLQSEELEDKWSENNETTPRHVFKSSHKKYKFICSKKHCGHEYEAALHKIVGKKGTRCPYCSKNGRKLCPDKSCKICIPSSFGNHARKIYWSPNNEGRPEDYTMRTLQKFLFICPKCEHEFSSALAHVTRNNRWCPYCAVPSKKVCKDEDCKPCFKRSFAISNRVEKWSEKIHADPGMCYYFVIKNFCLTAKFMGNLK